MDFKYIFLFVVVFHCFFCASSGVDNFVCNISYDDKLMEKMIWTQVKVEQMVKEFSKAESRVTAMLDDFKQALDRQNEKNDALKREIADLKDRAVVPTVLFFAYNINDASVEEGDRLRFTTEHFDVGSGYEPLTGIYTTPVAGVYQFTVQLYIADGRWLFFRIRSENKIIQKTVLFDDAGSNYGSQTAVGTTVLDANTKVWIEAEKSSGGDDIFLPHQHRAWNSFSGVLINNVN